MASQFDSDPVKLHSLFEGRDVLYRIPDYQRPYSWEERHIEQLWVDLHESWEEHREGGHEEPYFLGSLILVDNDKKRLDILDGQQRLTTFVIYYAVLRDFFTDELENHHLELIERRLTDTSSGEDRYRLRTGEKRQDEFETTILNGIDTTEENPYTKAADITREQLESLFETPEDLNEFFNFVERDVELVRIQTSDLTYAIRLFQTINTRGKDLTVSDLTKSFLLSTSTGEEQRDTVVETWKKLASRFDENYNALDNLLGSYRLHLQTTRAEQTVYEELKGEFETKLSEDMTAVDLANDIDRYAQAYIEVQNLESKNIFNLKNLKHTQYWKTILTTARKSGFTDFDELVEELVALYYSYWIAGHTSEKIKKPSYDLLDLIKDEQDIEVVREYIEEKRLNDNILQKVRESLYSDVYGTSWHRPLLIALEYQITGDKKIRRIVPGKDLHREHILPKKYQNAMEEEDYWAEHFNPDEAAQLRHSLGNIIPLEEKIHDWVLWKPYPVKADYYMGRVSGLAAVGSDRETTSFDLTRRVVDSYDDWNPEAVENFRKYLARKTADLLHFEEEQVLPDDST